MRMVVLLSCAFLCACAARPSNPVPISLANDDALTCAELDQRIAVNEAAALRLTGADTSVVQKNVAAGAVAATLFWPAIFALDLSNAEQIELRALRDRNKNLAHLKKKRSC